MLYKPTSNNLAQMVTALRLFRDILILTYVLTRIYIVIINKLASSYHNNNISGLFFENCYISFHYY